MGCEPRYKTVHPGSETGRKYMGPIGGPGEPGWTLVGYTMPYRDTHDMPTMYHPGLLILRRLNWLERLLGFY